MKRKSNQLTTRLDDELLADVEACCKITGLDSATFMREAFKAFVAEVKDKGEIRLPLALIAKSDLPKIKAAVVIPTPTFPSTAAPVTSRAHSVNEEEPARRTAVQPSSPEPTMTRTRAVLRNLPPTKSKK